MLSASDPRARRSSVALSELSDLGLQLYGDPDAAGSRAAAVRACRDAGFEPRLLMTAYPYATPDLDAGRAFALWANALGRRRQGIAVVALEPPVPTISAELVRREGVAEDFAAIARRVAAQLVLSLSARGGP